MTRLEGLMHGMESRLPDKIDRLGDRIDRLETLFEQHIGLPRQTRGTSRVDEEMEFIERMAVMYVDDPVHDTVLDTVHVSNDEQQDPAREPAMQPEPENKVQSQDLMDPGQVDEVQTEMIDPSSLTGIDGAIANEIQHQPQDMMPPDMQHENEGASKAIVLIGCAPAPLDEDVSMAIGVEGGVEGEGGVEADGGVEGPAGVEGGVEGEAGVVGDDGVEGGVESDDVEGDDLGGDDEAAQPVRKYNLRRRDQGGPQTAQILISPF